MSTNESIEEHRREMRRIWSSKRWKEFKNGFLTRYPGCDWCPNPSTVVHHIDDTSYGTDDYFNHSNCMALCKRCHWGIHHGLYICGKCYDNLVGEQGSWCKECRGEDESLDLYLTKQKLLKRKMQREQNERNKKWRKDPSNKPD